MESTGLAALLVGSPATTPYSAKCASASASGMSRLSSSQAQRRRTAADVIERGLAAVADQHILVDIGVAGVQRQFALQEFGERVAQGQLVLRWTARC